MEPKTWTCHESQVHSGHLAFYRERRIVEKKKGRLEFRRDTTHSTTVLDRSPRCHQAAGTPTVNYF